jgi:polyphosphate kinase
MAVGRRQPDPDRFINRELSWLDFNARVLTLAEDRSQPLLERAKFCAIFASNLDEFFQVRVAGLKDQVAGGVMVRSPDGRSPSQQLLEIRDRAEGLLARQEACYLEGLVGDLAEAGIQLTGWHDLGRAEQKWLTEEFHERIFPVLTPLAVDPSHPFPYISNLSLNLAVIARHPGRPDERFARVKVPSFLPRFLALPDGEQFVPVDQVIAAHLEVLFPGMEIVSSDPFRVTRNADLDLDEEEAEDLLAAVETELRRRRFGQAVRLEISETMTEDTKALLMEELELGVDDVYVCRAPIGLVGLFVVAGLDRPELRHTPLPPAPSARFAEAVADGDLFAELRRGDLLVHHPYVSFTSSVEAFLNRAAADPQVLAIKMTLYRTSGDTPIVEALIRAAELGKQVVVLVELKARFDEQANIEWAKRLEEAGVHVVYGLVGLKTHTKTTLVIRDEPDGLRRYCHIGTGNYNSHTARLYEDIGLFSVDPAIGNDLINLFNFLTGFGNETAYRKLLVAPQGMRAGLRRLIDGERTAGPGRGRITMKMNSLVDPDLIDELYAASRDGVDVDLIVRGICCLRPGVPGLSDRIRVRSIVGRYLEHSRIYHFANGAGPGRPACYIGSADLMPRNLDRRVEALVPVESPVLRAELEEVLEVNLADDTLAWELGAGGGWRRLLDGPGGGTVDTHLRLHELTSQRERAYG